MRHLVWICLLLWGCGGQKASDASTDADADSASSEVTDDSDDTGETDADSDPGPDPDATMSSAALDVDALALITTPEATRNHRFRFFVTWSDGTVERIDEGVEWSLNDVHIGSVDENGMFTTSPSRGGRLEVIGRYEGLVAMAEITVKYKASLVPEGFDISVFEAPEVRESGTGMTYPSDGIVVPKNQPAIHFQWENLGAGAYRLQFESEVTELTIYSTELSWISDSELWPVIGESNAGLSITSTLSARIGEQVTVKDSQSMSVQDLEATGSIIYWTPTAQGLMEIPYGEAARSFLTITETGHCVGCHAISSEGMVAFVYDSSSSPLGMKTIDGLVDVIPYNTAGNANYKTFSPDGSMLLTNLNGVLSLFDGITGAYLSSPTIDNASWVNNMDWAPDDSYLVFIDSPSASHDLTFSGGTIKRAEHLGDGAFGPAEDIASVADLDPTYGFTTIYYPVVSPDSRWVMFNASTGDTYDDPDATLFVVPIEGGTPIELAKANITASMGNSLPKWAPATAGDDVWWFAFASRRLYGDITSGNHQIWLSSFDPTKAVTGDDPSSVAIWLSNQDSAHSNHIPLWVK